MAIWLILSLSPALLLGGVRRSAWSIVTIFWGSPIRLILALAALNTMASIALLDVIGMWEQALLKGAILWYVLSGVALFFTFVAAKEDQSIWRSVVFKSLTIVFLMGFLVDAFTFSFWTEMWIIPAVTLVAVVGVFSSTQDRHENLVGPIDAVLSAIGLVLLAFAVRNAIQNWESTWSLLTLRQLALAPLLSILMVPLLYAAVLSAAYEPMFIRLNRDSNKPKRVKCYTVFRIFRHGRLSRTRVLTFVRTRQSELTRAQTQEEVAAIFLRASNR